MASKSGKHGFRPDDIEPRTGGGYPAPFGQCSPNRLEHALGDHAGLNQFGVNYTKLSPGDRSALRHWHSREDELVYILEGEVVLITDDGEETLASGMCVGFPAGIINGHQLVNRSDTEAVYLEIGSRMDDDECHYPDDDLHARKINGIHGFTRKDGQPV